MKRCKHHWCYVHVVWEGLVVRRYCSKCGAERVGVVTRWRREYKNEFEESPDEAARKIER